ncbi:uncharacterized protein [Drosophila kikkawai]|uniref:Single domain-containing protein n=1 Tax=Drosophila kikkawai TaxID=30033 RepID=A0A6P4JJI7_DROKI|nr:uncharacterized protein LOC108083500 [Drosophila kikkawai]
MSRFTVAAALLVASLILILGGSNTAQAATSRVKLANADHPGKCVLDTNTVLSPGQSGKLPDHPCAGATCHSDSLVIIKTCPAVAPPKGCKQRDFVNTNRSFPECCERAYDCNKHI